MKVIILGVVFTLFFFADGVFIGWAKDDFQYWSGYEFAKELGSQFELFYAPEFRVRENASEVFYHEHKQGARWKPSKYFEFGLNYLFARNKPAKGSPRWEHRGELEATPKISFGRWNLSVRGRTELRQVQGSSGEWEWRFRLRPKIAYKLNLRRYTITPYISDEIFYDVERDAWNQNRAVAGVVFPLGKLKWVQPSIDFYYMLQHNRSIRDDWNQNHIFGTKFTLRA